MKPPKILVAEDSLINQKLIERILLRLELEFAIVENGREAVERALSGGFDLIFMDLSMPVMNGFEAAAAIMRGLAPENQPAIIALTGATDASEREACLASGMKGFLTKPVTADNVRQLLQEFLPDGQ